MNLIEEFGSYEKAKKHQIERALNGLLHEYDFELVDALLEYRREHGIYEVGDKVVYSENLRNETINVIFEIWSKSRICEDNSYYLWLKSSKGLVHSNTKYFRHATPEEIKAGHRLP